MTCNFAPVAPVARTAIVTQWSPLVSSRVLVLTQLIARRQPGCLPAYVHGTAHGQHLCRDRTACTEAEFRSAAAVPHAIDATYVTPVSRSGRRPPCATRCSMLAYATSWSLRATASDAALDGPCCRAVCGQTRRVASADSEVTRPAYPCPRYAGAVSTPASAATSERRAQKADADGVFVNNGGHHGRTARSVFSKNPDAKAHRCNARSSPTSTIPFAVVTRSGRLCASAVAAIHTRLRHCCTALILIELAELPLRSRAMVTDPRSRPDLEARSRPRSCAGRS